MDSHGSLLETDDVSIVRSSHGVRAANRSNRPTLSCGGKRRGAHRTCFLYSSASLAPAPAAKGPRVGITPISYRPPFPFVLVIDRAGKLYNPLPVSVAFAP